MTENKNNYLNNPVDENPEDEHDQTLSIEEIERVLNSNRGNRLQMRFPGEENSSLEERASILENLLSNRYKD